MSTKHIACTLLAVGTWSLAQAAEPPAARPEYANPTFANPDTPGLMAGKPKAEVSNTADIIFLQQLSLGGRAEVELGKLTGQRGSSDQVDAFGARMEHDHGGANSKLASLARGAGVDLPKELDAEHEAARRELSALNGPDFDLKYIDGQIKDHQKALELLIHEIGSGQDSRVRAFATETLPAIAEHLELARAVRDHLVSATPPPFKK
jgi:putative membrane protein